MLDMFADCTALNELSVSSFNTSNCEDMEQMFIDMTSIKKNSN